MPSRTYGRFQDNLSVNLNLKQLMKLGIRFAEQKADTPGLKEILKPCAHPDNNIHKQEEHHKLCSPLPQGDKLKAILFDIDGTIADSDPIHFLAFQEVLAEVSNIIHWWFIPFGLTRFCKTHTHFRNFSIALRYTSIKLHKSLIVVLP